MVKTWYDIFAKNGKISLTSSGPVFQLSNGSRRETMKNGEILNELSFKNYVINNGQMIPIKKNTPMDGLSELFFDLSMRDPTSLTDKNTKAASFSRSVMKKATKTNDGWNIQEETREFRDGKQKENSKKDYSIDKFGNIKKKNNKALSTSSTLSTKSSKKK